MPNTNMTIRGSDAVGPQTSESLVGLPPKIYDENDPSYNSKKSKRFVFNKRIDASPKTEKYDIKGKTPSQLLALYYSLAPAKRGALLNQIYQEDPEQLAEMYFKASSDEKGALLTAVAKNTEQGSLIKIYDKLSIQEKGQFITGVLNATYEDLPLEQKKQLSAAVDQIFDKYINSLSKSERKAYLSKLASVIQTILDDDTKLSAKDRKALSDYVEKINKYLNGNVDKDFDSGVSIFWILVRVFDKSINTETLDQLSQINQTMLLNKFLQVAQKVLRENMKKEQDMVKKMDKGSNGKAGFWAAIAVIAVVVIIAVAPEFMPEAEDAALGASEAGESAEEAEFLDEDTEVVNPKYEPEDMGSGEFGMEMSDMSSEDVQVQEMDEANGAMNASREEAIQTEEKVAQNIGKAQTDTTSVKANMSRWERFKAKLPKILRIGKKVGYGVGAGFLTYMIMSQICPDQVPHGKGTTPMSAKDSAELQEYQSVANYENNVVNSNNNDEQTAAKRIGDDSEKISQDSGFIQQAINMFGQAFSYRA